MEDTSGALKRYKACNRDTNTQNEAGGTSIGPGIKRVRRQVRRNSNLHRCIEPLRLISCRKAETAKTVVEIATCAREIDKWIFTRSAYFEILSEDMGVSQDAKVRFRGLTSLPPLSLRIRILDAYGLEGQRGFFSLHNDTNPIQIRQNLGDVPWTVQWGPKTLTCGCVHCTAAILRSKVGNIR